MNLAYDSFDQGTNLSMHCYFVRTLLARIFHEYVTIHLVAGIVIFMQKDSLYQARRLPNANLF